MMRIAWICHFSTEEIRTHLAAQEPAWERWFIRKILHRPDRLDQPDACLWNWNGIREMEKMPDLELHVILPYTTLSHRTCHFRLRGVYYHAYAEQGSYFKNRLLRRFCPRVHRDSRINARRVGKIIASIQPQIVHLVGAESRDIAPCILPLNRQIPVIAQLQTLLEKPGFREQYYLSDADYALLSQMERRVLLRADFIGTTLTEYREIILRDIKPHARFLSTKLAVGVEVHDSYHEEKAFDFVYFALHIEKAADLAIEAFSLAHQEEPSLTLDVIGGAASEYLGTLQDRIDALGLHDAVRIEGSLPTHADVLAQVRKARFALLPLKVDFISGTLREAMASGLPLVTTVTEGTPTLNEERESALLSPMGDHAALARNMLKLYRNPDYAEALKERALQTVQERYSNRAAMQGWLDAYHQILSAWPLQ